MRPSAEHSWQPVTQELEAPPALADGAAPPAPPSILDALLAGGGAGGEYRDSPVQRFLDDPTFAGSLFRWLTGFDFDAADLPRRLKQRLGRDLARIDGLLDRQVNALLHHPDVQKLEASWRGLRYLVDQVPADQPIKVRVLSVTLTELQKDEQRASEFDQTELFRKVYTQEFDQPGGEPFGALVGDYEFKNQLNDLLILRNLARVAAAAFCPFIAAAHPHMLDLRSFAELQRPAAVEHLGKQMDGELPYLKWRQFREHEDSRFVALALPRVLMREPYRADTNRVDGFRFREQTGKPDGSEYLWGNAAYAYGGVLIRAFDRSGWLADIRGFRRGEVAGGLVPGLSNAGFDTDRRGLIPRPATDVVVTDAQERALGELGFLPLSWCQDTETATFHGCQSVQKAKSYDKLEATVNAKMSSMLQYMLCVSRFAHYLKAMMRDMVGMVLTPEEVQSRLRRWIWKYTDGSSGMTPERLAKAPLRDARVDVFEIPGRPGRYGSRIFLQPQFQLDNLVGQIRLETR
ncbi:MAG: type VI secretion system contractile sheath large subunit [Gemmataceae bacterium]